ncbi:MAG: ribonuclease HII [Candidatus Niyogibacteria bacterium]|nr:ribonuclease HII [Candidatus Niyogibacteria bacterium]
MRKQQRRLIGIDEVGRGPLAGPITIAAFFIRGSKRVILGIKDSKRLSPKKREEWFLRFKNHPRVFFAHASVGNTIIDKKGISYATRLAVARSLRKLEKLDSRPKIYDSRILLDGGLEASQKYKNQQTIIRGDKRIPIIAAASIIAKVTRDRKMIRLAKIYPQYGFEIHKAYGTKAHMKAIKKHGLCDIHRRSFCRKFL